MNARRSFFSPASRLLWSILAALAVLASLAPAAEPKHEMLAPAVPAPKDVGELKAIETQVQEMVAKVMPSVVGVRVGSFGGSGVIVSEDGYVMTAGHVVGEPGREVTFVLAGGKTVKGVTLGVFKNADAGLMKISDNAKWPFVEMGRSADLQSGTWCVAVGHPLGIQPDRPAVIRIGRVLRARDTVIQTDCPLVGGDSGGPLLNLEGKVIGINNRIGGSTSMNYHVPVDVYHDNWDRLAKSEVWQVDLPGRDSDDVKAAFRAVVAEAAKCAVRVKCDGKDAALGTIVGPDGWILTKASELKGKIVCRMRDQRELEAEYVGVHEPFDLAMLKVDAFDLPAIPWNKQPPKVGQWVAVPGLDDDPLAVGVVSVPPRGIRPISGILGVVLKSEEANKGALIEKVLPNSPAAKAGLKVNDLITHVNDKPTPDHTAAIAEVRQHRPGETVKVKLKRGDKELEFSVKLAALDTPATRKRNLQNSMGVGVSKRRDGFPTVLQHDTVVRPVDCGGPLVDLSGKVVGVNIARGGRTETYAAPTDVLLTLMYDLMSGRLTPPEVKKERERLAEEARKKAEAEQKAKEEAERKAKEEAERKAKEEEERKQAEAAKKAEEERKKAEAERKAKEEEERRKAEEAKKAEPDENAPEKPQKEQPEKSE